MALGQRLPSDDHELDQVLAALVTTRNELAFSRIVLAALAVGRRVDARHLVEGAALFPDVLMLCTVVWHLSGPVGEALIGAVKTGLMGAEREATALALAAAWYQEHSEQARSAELVTQARLLARRPGYNWLALDFLMIAANLTSDEGLKTLLKSLGVPDHPPEEKAFLEELLPDCRQSPLATVPENPPLAVLSGYTVRRAVERVGRNDPCPCGSGKKYKKCCYEKDRDRLLQSSAVPGVTVGELRQQPELAITRERLETMRSYELCKLDPGKVPAPLRALYGDRLLAFGLVEEVVSALEKWPGEDPGEHVWECALFEIVARQNRPLLERLVRLKPATAEPMPFLGLSVDLLLAGEEGRQQLDLVERAAAKALGAEKPLPELVDVAYGLLSYRPALGILAARGVIPLVNPLEAEGLLGELLIARDKLNLSPDDPMCEVVDACFSASEEDPAGEPEELREARQALQTKGREMRKLQKELAGLHRELEQREKSPQPPPASSAAPPRNGPRGRAGLPAALQDLPAGRTTIPSRPEKPSVPTGSASLEKSVVRDPELNALRERVASLKSLLKERHSERNQLRRELDLAKTQIESFRQKPPVAPDAAEEAEERLLGASTLEGKQPVRLPEFPRKFHESVSALPPSVARACLGLAGRLAGGDPSAFAGVKRLKSLPDVYRARVSEDNRLLFRLHPARVEILDLINRRDLERKIKAMM